jgi:hypothetical protein
MLLIAPRKFLGVEQRRDAGATGQGVICPAEINSEFRQQGRRPPTGMRPAQVQAGITHSHRKSAERSAGGATHLGVEAGAPLVLPTAAPFAHRPDRATRCRRNRWDGLSGGGSFGDVQPLPVAATRYDFMRLCKGAPGTTYRDSTSGVYDVEACTSEGDYARVV